MKHFITTESAVLGFCVGDHQIDCLCANKLQKFDKASGQLLFEKMIFDKNGLARILTADNGQLFVSDFCTLYAFDQHTYELLGKWQLGEDLTSDICGMTMDDKRIYCSIRNGKIITIDRTSFQRTEHIISDSSMWSLKSYRDHLLCGTVSGQLLLLNKASLSIEKRLFLSRQNIRSLFIDADNDPQGGILYASAQDKKLFQIDLSQFEILTVQKNAHAKMFDCAGTYHDIMSVSEESMLACSTNGECDHESQIHDILVTVSHPCGEISFWDKHSFQKIKTLSIPLKLSGNTYLEGDQMYLTSRNINGIGLIDLKN